MFGQNSLVVSVKIWAKIMTLGILVYVGFLVFMPAKSYAALPSTLPNAQNLYGDQYCTGTSAGNFNLVIFVRILNSDGSTNRYSRNFSFQINSYEKASANNNEKGVYRANKNKSIVHRNNGAAGGWGPGPITFTARADNPNGVRSWNIFQPRGGNACTSPLNPADGYQTAFAFRDGDETSLNCWPPETRCAINGPNRHEADNNENPLLSCLGSNATAYLVSNVIVNDGDAGGQLIGPHMISRQGGGGIANAGSGPNWIHMQSDAGAELNVRDMTLVFDYRLPPPPEFVPEAAINGATGGEVEAGSDVTATGKIHNSTTTGTVYYTRHFWYDDGNGNYTGAPGDKLIATSPKPPLPWQYDVTIAGGTVATLDDIPLLNVDSSYNQICTALALSNPRPAGAKIITPNSGVCYPIVRRPYFKVYNGDINAAIKTCNASTTTGTIKAYNLGPGDYKGSGTSIAAFAAGQIEGFTSAMRGATKPKYLSFANTGSAPANSRFGGGGANAVTSCVSGSDIPAIGHSIDGEQATGSDDVFITSNNSYPTTFGLGNMPNHTVTAKGNIFISSDVTELNGVFKAGRNIYTCATAAGVLPNKSDAGPDGMTQKCSKPLTVNGALIASNVYLMRTTGSLISPNPAEKIILSPEAWIKSLVDGGTTGKKLNTQYDAILNMPPVL